MGFQYSDWSCYRPDLVVVDKERSCKIIDFAVPGDSRIEEKEKDKIEKYQDLGRELQKIWNVKVKIIALVVGFLGAMPKQFGNRLKQFNNFLVSLRFWEFYITGQCDELKNATLDLHKLSLHFLKFFIKNLCFYHFYCYFWWSIEVPQQSITNQKLE